MSSGTVFAFGEFALTMPARRLTRGADPVSLSPSHSSVLALLVEHAGDTLSKDALIAAGWGDVAVTDNSLEQAISVLRRTLGTDAAGRSYVETVPRKGYRFVGDVTISTARTTDDALDELLAPHRAFLEGRAALESLEQDAILRARAVFERVVARVPNHASAHVGLANASILGYEVTRLSGAPDLEARTAAVTHAQEACRLDAHFAETWATLGFVLNRTGAQTDALAASRRAVMLDPASWRHHLRLAYVSWGEERLRAAHRTLALMPGLPQAHWFAASVHVARQALAEAERELEAGIAALDDQLSGAVRFSGVGLHWLRGLLSLAAGETELALASFRRELAAETSGHLYARESCASAWYAVGATRLRQGDAAAAASAFREALTRIPYHGLARVGLVMLGAEPLGMPGVTDAGARVALAEQPLALELALAAAANEGHRGAHEAAAHRVGQALAAAPMGSDGWLIPLEPLLNVAAYPGAWDGVLRLLRARAA